MIELTFYELPKISLNKWYAGMHWTKRKAIKDTYKLLLNQPKYDGIMYCSYQFEFKNNPLDASNCVAMVKLIEDCIISDDGYKSVQGINITSRKGKRDKVIVKLDFKLE